MVGSIPTSVVDVSAVVVVVADIIRKASRWKGLTEEMEVRERERERKKKEVFEERKGVAAMDPGREKKSGTE